MDDHSVNARHEEPRQQRPAMPVTEAQLRWARFHLKRTAAHVQTKVSRLWMTPASPSQVEGAQSDDGNSTTSSLLNEESSTVGNSSSPTREQSTQQQAKTKPRISRGRRALLRVSKRAWMKRKEAISKQGFQCQGSFDENDVAEEDALTAIFAGETFWRKKRQRQRMLRRRHRFSNGGDEDERVRRFESAFRAMMESLAAATQQPERQQQQQVPTKRWTRPDGPLLLTVDGRDYADLKWGVVSHRQGSLRNPHIQTASWLQHYGDVSMSRYHNFTQEPNADFMERRRIFETGELADTTKSTPTAVAIPKDAVGFVQQFVAQMEQAAQVENLISADGKLHKPTFARLVMRYLGHASSPRHKSSWRSPLSNSRSSVGSIAQRRRSQMNGNTDTALDNDADRAPSDESSSSGFVRNFIAQIERAADEESLVTDEGKLDTVVFERLITQYLAQAADQTLAEAREQDGSSELPTGKLPQTWKPETIPEDRDNEFVTPRASSRELDASLTREEASTREPTENIPTASKQSSRTTEFASRLVGSVTDKVGGLMKILNVNAEGGNASEEQAALAAFRKTRKGRKGADDASSTSSFQVLPEGFKSLVKSFRGKKLSENPEHPVTADDDATMESSEQEMQVAPSFDSLSSNHALSTASSGVAFSPERLKDFHHKMMEKSALIGGADADQTIIDTDGSDTTGAAMPSDMVASLLLSPTILTKRLHQAIRAIENRNWDQVQYLMSANPWLAEMTDFKSNQYLLHKLAFYGSGDVNVDPETGLVVSIRHPPAPDQINKDLIRMFASAVHKFDRDGNLPLHMSCASANLPMIKLLGDRFPSGASVRNEDGMLPLHLAILSCAAPISALGGDSDDAVEIVRSTLSYFPAAVGVTDNEGNLPIHTAASILVGDIGVDVIFLLLDEAERQARNPSGVRFRNKISLEEVESLSMETETTAAPTVSSNHFDDVMHCNMVVNDQGETPLTVAIRARAGWEVIEAIACGQGGVQAALCCDEEKNTALHLLASGPYLDLDALISILKVAPETAGVANADGMLPIELACMQMLPYDIILAMALEDLPVDIDRDSDLKLIEGRGASWWYLACDCDDSYAAVVEEIVSYCTYEQVRVMCSVQASSSNTLLNSATPLCQDILQRALRLAGRFELIGDPIFSDSVSGLKVYNALDFADGTESDQESKPVLVKSFSKRQAYQQEISLLRFPFDFSLVEEIVSFSIGSDSNEIGAERHFISIEQPSLTLGGVLRGMMENEECQIDSAMRQRYGTKVFSVLRIIAKAICHLHSLGIVHGNVNVENCCKYYDNWKLADVLKSQRIGEPVQISRLSSSSPPESIEPLARGGRVHQATFKSDYVCSPAMDCWGFGKVAYEALVGQELVRLDSSKRFEEDHRAMMDLLHWNDFNCDEVFQRLREVGVEESGATLVAACLSPDPEKRPTMEEVLKHATWKELRERKRAGAV